MVNLDSRFNIGYILRRDREAANLSQDRLAKLAKVSRRHVSNIEGNTAGASAKTVSKLFTVLSRYLTQ